MKSVCVCEGKEKSATEGKGSSRYRCIGRRDREAWRTANSREAKCQCETETRTVGAGDETLVAEYCGLVVVGYGSSQSCRES